jgi:hypothetical protein
MAIKTHCTYLDSVLYWKFCNKYISPQVGIESHSLILSLIVFQELVLATTLVTDAKSGRNFQYKTESRYVQ